MSVSEGQGPEDRRPRGSRWLKGGLIVSLALNLLIIGAVAGAAWIFWHGGPEAGRHRAFARAVTKLMHELPEDRMQSAREILERHRDSMGPLRARMRDARRTVATALESEPFSEVRLREALAAMDEVRDEMRTSLQELTVSFVKQLGQDERKRFLRYMTRGRWRGEKQRRE